MGQSLADILDQAAEGRYPPTDGGVTILAAQPSPRAAGVIAFTAHAVIFIDADAEWVAGLLPPGTRRAPTCWPSRRRGPASRASTSSP